MRPIVAWVAAMSGHSVSAAFRVVLVHEIGVHRRRLGGADIIAIGELETSRARRCSGIRRHRCVSTRHYDGVVDCPPSIRLPQTRADSPAPISGVPIRPTTFYPSDDRYLHRLRRVVVMHDRAIAKNDSLLVGRKALAQEIKRIPRLDTQPPLFVHLHVLRQLLDSLRGYLPFQSRHIQSVILAQTSQISSFTIETI